MRNVDKNQNKEMQAANSLSFVLQYIMLHYSKCSWQII